MEHFGRIAYADCFSGISGDMFLGALLHAGLDESVLRKELAKLNLDGALLAIEYCTDHSIGCCKVSISQDLRQDLRTLPDILAILDRSGLDPIIRRQSAAVFQTLADAEAKVHAIDVGRVHFHEIGAMDTIIDVVGSVIGLHHLGITQLIVSPLPLGSGFVQCDHGTLPLPAPAVCELTRGIPVYGVDMRVELVTPTGAALARTLADSYGPLPPMSITATGYGAGSRRLPKDQPNLLRLLIGTAESVEEVQTVTVVETRLDDWNPETFPFLCDILLEHGALDVSLSTCMGKKGRPGFHLQVLSNTADNLKLQDIILSETTAIGLRYRREHRRTLPREHCRIPSPWGEIVAKKVLTPRGAVIYPEYEECKKTALRNGVGLDEVYRAVYGYKDKHI